MKCRSCSAEIADKAIVCYKCGTPTAIPAPPVRPSPPAGGRAWLPLMLLVAALVSGWMAYRAESTLERWGAIAAGVVLVALAAEWRRRARRNAGLRVH